MQELSYEQAMSYALRLLGFRRRTEKELIERLAGKGYDSELRDRVLARLKEWGYIDDRSYVEGYVRSKVKPSGKHLLKRELLRKGVDKEVVERGLEKNYTREQELQAAEELAVKLWHQAGERNTGLEQTKEMHQKNWQKTANRLLARGFSYDIVKVVLRKVDPDFNNED